MNMQQFTSPLISIVTGIIIVVLVEIFLWIKTRIKRKCEITYIRDFIKKCEKQICDAQAIVVQNGSRIPKAQLQLAYHQEHLRTAIIIISVRSPHLTKEQNFEILKIFTNHTSIVSMTADKNIFPHQNFYDTFFEELKKLQWLKF